MRKVSQKRMNAWKKAIRECSPIPSFCRQAACLLIDESQGLTKPVRFVTNNEEFGKRFANDGGKIGKNNIITTVKEQQGIVAYIGSASHECGILGNIYGLFLDPAGIYRTNGMNYSDIPFDPVRILANILP